jgi:peptide/nickel transport system substrate-binding protein
MHRRTTLLAIAAATTLTLSACGGSGEDKPAGSTQDTNRFGDTGNGQDATAAGPVTIDGAQKGGIVTVLTLTGLTTTIDTSEIYYTDSNAIMSDLVTRSLTQYRYNPDTKQMILVPDLATGSKINGDFDDNTLGMPTYKNIWISR